MTCMANSIEIQAAVFDFCVTDALARPLGLHVGLLSIVLAYCFFFLVEISEGDPPNIPLLGRRTDRVKTPRRDCTCRNPT